MPQNGKNGSKFLQNWLFSVIFMIVQDGAGAIDWSNWLPVRPDLP